MDVSNGGVIRLAQYWHVLQYYGQCRPISHLLLYFVCLWTFAAAWALILGNIRVRGWLVNKLRISQHRSDTGKHLTSLFCSLVVQVGMTALTAFLLTDKINDQLSQGFHYSFFAWIARPLPASLVTVVSFVSSSAYARNAFEIQRVECAYSCLSVYLQGDVMVRSFRLSESLLPPSDMAKHGLKLLKAGSTLSFITTVAATVEIMISFHDARVRLIPLARLFVLSGLRLAANFVLWVGASELQPDSFCPSGRNLSSIMAIWALTPCLDHLVRAMFSPEAGNSNNNHSQIELGHVSVRQDSDSEDD